MTIRLSWPSQAEKGLTGIEIYRKVGWDATLDIYNPGTPYAQLPSNSVEFIEEVANLTTKTIYKYWIAAVKGTERLFSQPITQGFYLDTGPGPKTLTRGDWHAGYFGTVAGTDFFTSAELRQLLSTARAAFFQAEAGTWYKFVYNGRIIYIPYSRHSTGYTLFDVYAQGMLYGTDDNGSPVPSGKTAVLQDAKVTKNGLTYRIRLPYATNYDPANIASTSPVIYNAGEWRNTMGRMYTGMAATYPPAGMGAWGSLASGSAATVTDPASVTLAPLYSATISRFSNGSEPMGISLSSSPGTELASMRFVLELILP